VVTHPDPVAAPCEKGAEVPPTSILLRAWFRPAAVASPEATAADADLVRRFVDTRDDGAFAELVRRHGPMVLATCRRVLHPDDHGADDAFQATFLVLATRAAAVSPAERVGAFLHGVAVHVARKARRQTRKVVSAPAVLDLVPARPSPDPDAADLRAKLDDVLAGLPAKYHCPIVLCDLEQRSRAEAAAILGWSEGTLSGRLARARKLLADRLARRGLAPPAAGLGVALPASAATANVPLQLAASTVHLAILASAGAAVGAAGGAIPASVAALAQGVPMHTSYKPFAAVLALVLGVFALYALAAPSPSPPTPDRPVVAQTWVRKHTFTHEAAVDAVAFDGDRVAAGDRAGRLRLWDAKAGEKHELLVETAKLTGARRPQPISSVQFSPDRKALYFALDQGSIHQYSLDKDGKKDRRLFPDYLQLAANVPHGLTPDGKFWLESSDLFDPVEHSELLIEPNLLGKRDEKIVGKAEATFVHDARVTYAAIGSADVVVSVTSSAALRRWKKGEAKAVWEEKLGKFEATALALCPRREVAAVGGKDGRVRLYSAENGKLLHVLEGHAKAVTALAFSPDGKRLVTGSADTTARTWDAEKGKELAVLKGHAGRVNAVAYGPRGDRIVTAGADKTVRVWQWGR